MLMKILSEIYPEESMLFVCIIFAVIVPYLLCSLNPAIIAGRVKHGRDIREMGSGNPGLTNALRTMGKGAAAFVLLFDVGKGVVSIFAVSLFCGLLEPAFAEDIAEYLCMWIGAFFAVLGHCFPVYYRFKGGKAALVTVATCFVINWAAAIIALSVFILLVLITRYVSVGSMIAAVVYALSVGVGEFTRGGLSFGVVFAGAIAVIIIVKHRENIARLAAGNEKKLGKKEKT
jgi:glycerol-3-phosphate acyltransferase PlsY